MQQALASKSDERPRLGPLGEGGTIDLPPRRLLGADRRHYRVAAAGGVAPAPRTAPAGSDRQWYSCFDAWFCWLHPLAYNVGRQFCHPDTAFAEDVAQETLTRAFVAWERLERHPNLEAWVCVTAARVALELDRQQRRGARPTSNFVAEDPDERLADGDVVAQALAQLSPRQQHVVVYRYCLDQSVQQTADRLGLTTSKVKDATHEAVTKLARLLRARAST